MDMPFKVKNAENNRRAILDPDVVVIGSGASGGIVSYVLATNGVKVVTLESGPLYGVHEYPSAKKYPYEWGLIAGKWEKKGHEISSKKHLVFIGKSEK